MATTTTKTVKIPEQHYCNPYKRISWSAILIGALVGLGLSFLLNLFGIAIGLSAFTVDSEGGVALVAGGVIALIISTIAAMVVSGYAAGYLGRYYSPQRNLGIVYGFATWSAALVLSAVIGAHVSSYVTSYTNTISRSTVVMDHHNNAPASLVVHHDDNTNNDANQRSMKATTSADTLAWGAFSVFVLFFIGAIAACIGACWGMSSQRQD